MAAIENIYGMTEDFLKGTPWPYYLVVVEKLPMLLRRSYIPPYIIFRDEKLSLDRHAATY